ncbi:MAG: sugar porter family MFS transporter [Thermoplasmatales archaeon]|nr:sugar porter family MFS transporter [Thermoplasmatales archaeon]MCW6170340.1 sugar porter family MFS transporter [Thermoplasmatales archaeon]
MNQFSKSIGMGSIISFGEFLDAFFIVGFSVELTRLSLAYKIPTLWIGLVPAFFGFSWATTAILGSHLADKIGRKTIYTYDLIIMLIGTAIMLISSYAGYNLPILAVGYVIVGVGVGFDIPASEALLAEISPTSHRGKMMSLSNIWWYIGPMVALIIALFSPTTIQNFRNVFYFATIWIIFTLIMRKWIVESPRYLALKAEISKINAANPNATNSKLEQQEPSKTSFGNIKIYKWTELFSKRFRAFTIYIIFMDIFFALGATIFGIYLPYLATTLGKKGFVGGVTDDMIWFGLTIIGILVYWSFIDKPAFPLSRRIVFIISSIGVAIGFVLFGVSDLKNPSLIILSVGLIGFFQGFGMWPLIWLWGTEVFPTAIRSAGRGVMGAVHKYFSYSWTFVFPAILIATGIRNIAYVVGLVSVIMAISTIWLAPRESAGKSLEELESTGPYLPKN